MADRITKQVVERALENLGIAMGIPTCTTIRTGVTVHLKLERNGKLFSAKVVNVNEGEIIRLTDYGTLREVLNQIYAMNQAVKYTKFLYNIQ